MASIAFVFGIVNIYVFRADYFLVHIPRPMILTDPLPQIKSPLRNSTFTHKQRDDVHPRHDDTGRARVVRILKKAGVANLTLDEIRLLPTWQQITNLYGAHPRILVRQINETHQTADPADHCASFRAQVPPERRILGSAGMFSTGTNLVTTLLKKNCYIPQRAALYGHNASKELLGVRWQVPWGKHTQQQFRDQHSTEKAKGIVKDDVLPVVTIRHPISWMQSMCKHPYTAQWPHDEFMNCPNLGGQESSKHNTNSSPRNWTPVKVKYGAGTQVYESLAHLYNDWYNGYAKHAAYPWVMIRMEDLVFHTEETIEQVCTCAGGQSYQKEHFQYTLESAKADSPGHDTSTGLIQAWIKYSQAPKVDNWSIEDVRAAHSVLDSDLMEFFGYNFPS